MPASSPIPVARRLRPGTFPVDQPPKYTVSADAVGDVQTMVVSPPTHQSGSPVAASYDLSTELPATTTSVRSPRRQTNGVE